MIDVIVKFNVNIPDALIRKLEVIVSEFKSELGGFIIGKVNEDSIDINDIIFPNQTVGSTSVDIDAKDVLKLRNDSRWKDLLGFWHSHLTMGTFFSSGNNGDESHIRFLSQDKHLSVFIVSSHKDYVFDHKVRVEVSKPIKITFDNGFRTGLPFFETIKSFERLTDETKTD